MAGRHLRIKSGTRLWFRMAEAVYAIDDFRDGELSVSKPTPITGAGDKWDLSLMRAPGRLSPRGHNANAYERDADAFR
jgi:hypothetical protein